MTAHQTVQLMMLQMAQCSAHLTALSTAQLMEHQTVQLMGQLTARCWGGHSLQHGRQRN